jgi:methylated-DNA-[protein]-cysteine S-methyltransferase
MTVKNRIKHIPVEAQYHQMASPVGTLTLIASQTHLWSVLWDVDFNDESCNACIRTLKKSNGHALMMEAEKQIDNYFYKKCRTFNIPLNPVGTAFQMQAWQVLQNISYGDTISYGEQALRLGDKNKARAVGMANGANPLSIIIPCHRVIGASGTLVGFGGGVEKKQYLLDLEKQ